MELNEKNSPVAHHIGTSSLARAEATPTIVRGETESLILPAPVALKDRIFSLDVIRGVALLGILLANSGYSASVWTGTPADGRKTGGSQKYWVLVAPNQYMESGRIAAHRTSD